MLLFSPFAPPPICSRLNAATCKCNRLRVIECRRRRGGRALIHYKLMLLYACVLSSSRQTHTLGSLWLIIMTNTTQLTVILYDIRGDWIFVFILGYFYILYVCDAVMWCSSGPILYLWKVESNQPKTTTVSQFIKKRKSSQTMPGREWAESCFLLYPWLYFDCTLHICRLD